MKIEIIATHNSCPDHINMGLFESLCRAFKGNDAVTLVDRNPDIIHLFGLWDGESMAVIRKFKARNIPVVFTSADGLVALGSHGNGAYGADRMRSYVKRIAREAAAVHVCGSVERTVISRQSRKARLVCIRNSHYTALATEQEMLYDMSEMYKSTLGIHEESVRNSIERRIKDAGITDKVMAEIVSKLMYLHCLEVKGSIPHQYIDELSDTLTAADYDEQQMRMALHKVKLYKFASRAMQMLADCSTLTEGFMPLPPTYDKRTEALKACIIE